MADFSTTLSGTPELDAAALDQAAQVITKKLEAAGITGAKVIVAVTPERMGINASQEFSPVSDEEPRQNLSIIVDHPRALTEPVNFGIAVNKVLGTLDTTDLVKVANFISEGEHAEKLRDDLAKLKEKGLDMPEVFLDWRAMKKKLISEWGQIRDHALTSVDKLPKFGDKVGVLKSSLHVPLTAEEQKDPKAALESSVANITARIPDIKTKMAERYIKYKNITAEEEKAAVFTAVNALKFDVLNEGGAKTPDGFASNDNHLSIIISGNGTPETDAIAKRIQEKDAVPTEAEIKTLNATNILTELPMEQLVKMMGRSILHAGPGADDFFAKVAGRNDMKTAISKSLFRLERDKPELKEWIENVRNDDAFKNHESWGMTKKERDENKGRVDPIARQENGKISIDFNLERDQPMNIIRQIATIDVSALQAPAEQAVPAQVSNGVGQDASALAADNPNSKMPITAALTTQLGVTQSPANPAMLKAVEPPAQTPEQAITETPDVNAKFQQALASQKKLAEATQTSGRLAG